MRERVDSRRLMAFVALAITCLIGVVGSILLGAQNRSAISGAGVPSGDSSGGPPGAAMAEGPRLVFQSVTRGFTYAHIASVPLGKPDAAPAFTDLVCERMHFAGGHGLCLVPENGVVSTFHAYTFGDDFVARARIPLSGPVTRARVSADGRYGAATVFVFGHSYADADFSTQTLLIDMATSRSLGDLELFRVLRDGAPIASPDFNFWGVTFAAASDRFYASLRTSGRIYLVEGSVERREIRVLQESVECPSLSPDGTRIAFKKRIQVGLETGWRLHVLDLATGKETPLAEERSVDDQVEWLDDATILYGLDAGLWAVPADGSGEPRLFLADALSPAVVRDGS